MKKVMKFVKGKKEDDNIPKNLTIDAKKLSIDKSDDSFKEDDFINRDKSVTKLHKAVWNENSEKLKTIIKTHDIDITDRFDRTALYLAVIKNNPSIINLLLENNANQNIPDIDGITPFLKSIQLGYKDCAATLLNHGADLKKTDKDLNSCLHFAVIGKHNEILSFLLEYDIDCNVSNVNGDYPLHIAIRMQNIQLIDQLLKNKSDINVLNVSGKSALMLAEQQNNPKIMSLIDKYNAKVLCIPSTSDDVSLKSSYENLKKPEYFLKSDSTTDTSWNDTSITSTTNMNSETVRNTTNFYNNEDAEMTEENSEEAEVSIKRSENTSPQSGIIPPPCKPLRSLEYLQTGMTIESRPVHLLTLGTVRTRHISMTESDQSKNNTPHRYSYQGDFQSPVTSETCKIPDDKGDSIKSKLFSKLECDSTLQSDWGSNESLPLDEFSFRRDKSNSNNSNSGSIKDKLTTTTTQDSFLQKQFSILEDYERNCEKRCVVSYQNAPTREPDNKFDDIENLLEDNNRINAQLERYAGQSDVLVRSAKSKSLPRNCEPYSGYHNKGSYSLPRTLEAGKDPFREMRSYGNFKSRSHFFSLKMLKGEKKNTFLDKLKSMFNKKSQIHLQDQESNGTWLYKEKYKLRRDHEFYSSKLDTFSMSDSSSSRKSHHSDMCNEMRCGLQELEEDELNDVSFTNNEQNQVIEQRNRSLNNYLRKPSGSNQMAEEDEQRINCKDKEILNTQKILLQEILCEDCFEIFNLKLAETEENLLGKEKIIQLLKEQLGLLTERNVKSINEAQNIGCKYSLAKQELETVKHICAKYEEELQRLRLEKANKQKKDELTLKFKEDADRWKKQYEDLLAKIQKNTTPEDDWRNTIQNEVTTAVSMLKENSQSLIGSLEKQNQKLEVEVEKLHHELEASRHTEQELKKDLNIMKNHLDEIYYQSEKDMKSADERIHQLRQCNDKLTVELEHVKRSHKELQKLNDHHLKSLEDGDKENKCLKHKCKDLQVHKSSLESSLIDLITEINDLKKVTIENIQKYNNIENSISITEVLEKCEPQTMEITEENAIEICHNLIINLKQLNDLNSVIVAKLNEMKNQQLKENDDLRQNIIEKSEEIQQKDTEINLKDLTLKDAVDEILILKEKLSEANDIMDELQNDLQNKIDVTNMQSSKILDLKEILEDEIQKYNELSLINKSLKSDLEKHHSEIGNLTALLQQEKNLNKKVSNESIELRNTLETFNREKYAIEQQNIDMKSSFLELEKEKTTLEEKCSFVTNSNQGLRKMIETNKEKITNLEKFNQQLQDKLSEHNHTDDRKLLDFQRKIDLLTNENVALKALIEGERENQAALRKQFDSLEMSHANEIQSKASIIDGLTSEVSELQLKFNNDLKQFHRQSEEKFVVVEDENNKLYDIIYGLNKDILSLNKKLEDVHNLSDPEKYNEAIQIINEENHQLNQKINSLQKQLEQTKGVRSDDVQHMNVQKDTEKLVEIDVASQKVTEKDVLNKYSYIIDSSMSSQTTKSYASNSTGHLSSYKESDISSIEISNNDELIQQISNIQSALHSVDISITSSSDENKSTSLPNLGIIKRNKTPDNEDPDPNPNPDQSNPIEKGCALIRKTSSLECLANNETKLSLSQTTLDSHKGKCDNCLEKQLSSVYRLRKELNDVLMKLNMRHDTGECFSPECTNKFKLVVETLQRQVNELNLKSAEESQKCYGLQAELKGMKGQMVNKETMTEEIKKLRKELYKQKVESVQEIEKCRIKKEAEILEIQFKLKQQFLKNKLKLLADLADVQTTLQKKTDEENRIKEKCDSLMKQINVNQDIRHMKNLTLFPESPVNTNIDPVLETGLREIFQPVLRQSFEHPEFSGGANSIRTKLNTTIEKHRLDAQESSLPAVYSSEDEELKEKYLLQ